MIIIIIIVTISVNAKASYNLEIESTRYFWKCTVVSHSWYCPYLVESVMSLSCRIAAENSQKKNWRGSHHNNNNNNQESIRESYYDRDSKDLRAGICADPQKGASVHEQND